MNSNQKNKYRPPYHFSAIAILLLFFANLPDKSFGQYFGRNKVQYDQLDFRVMRTPHFNVHYYPEFSENIIRIAHLSERWYQRFSPLLRHSFINNPIIIYASHPDFQQTEVIQSLIGVGVGGVTEAIKNRLIMPLAGTWANTDHVLGHEMVHVFQYNILRMNDTLGLQNMNNLPLWLVEGMAEYLSLGPEDSQSSMWMRDAVMNEKIPTFRQLTTRPEFNPYRFGHAAWSFMAGQWGDDVIADLYRESAMLGFEQAVELRFGITHDSLSTLWAHTLQEHYRPQIIGRTIPDKTGDPLVITGENGGDINIAPVLSPDGKHFIFLSEKEVFTIDLFLADAETGEIIRKLASSAADAHYEEIRFIESAGTWSPDSRHIAFSAISKGTTKIIIQNLEGELQRTITFAQLDEIVNPAWSPDGRYLAFSGSYGGMADIYLYDLELDTLEQLTSGEHADLQPAWSPDGSTIAFMADRGDDTEMENLKFGKMKIAFLELASREVTVLQGFENTKHINPVYSRNGASVYFVADPDGISNVYRYQFDSGEFFKVTNIATGISGITDLSPAITVGKNDGKLLFSVFDQLRYKIHALSEKAALGIPLPELFPAINGAALPPSEKKGIQSVEEYLADPSPPVLSPDTFRVQKYRPKLTLDFIGDAGIGVVGGQFGAGFGGGGYLQFSDMLARHTILAAVQGGGRLESTAGQALYINRSSRFNWGGMISHIPFFLVRSFITEEPVDPNGTEMETVLNQEVLTIFEDQALGLSNYPVSMINRIELNGGFTRYSFLRRNFRSVLRNNFFVRDEIIKLDAPEALNIAHLTAAYVGDNTFFGITAPLKGYRYRLQAGANAGSLDYLNIIADYRHYLYRKPLSLAFRGLHFARYLGDAENRFLPPFFLGFWSFVRGYDLFTFDPAECNGDFSDCPVFDRLFGSKMAIGNLEVRMPFTGPRQIALIDSRFVLTSFNLFFDAGVAWTEEELPQITPETGSPGRIPVFSTGISTRINVLGAMVLEIYYAYPFQRPVKGPHFGFQIVPGW